MNRVDRLFRNRIGFPDQEKVTLTNLNTVLEMTAAAIPFENLCAISGDNSVLNQENLVEKIFTRNEGGLCYDLNSVLYLFLRENGLDVQIVRGAVYVPELDGFSPTGNTHAAIILTEKDEQYLVDTGFGGNLPLTPVPLDGQEVTSANGVFQVKKEASEFGDYFLEMKLKHKDSDWRKGYAFDTLHPVGDIGELNESKRIITDHPRSPFNKKPLLTRVTANGSMVLTDTSFTQWLDGRMVKEEIDGVRFKELARQHFKMNMQ